MSTTKPIAGFRQAPTNVGDTVQAIALRELGDASRWYDLVHVNGLVPPYLTDDLSAAGPSVLLAGQQSIKIPAPAPPASGVADATSVFGTDMSLAGGRLAAAAGGDFLTVAGVPNLTQALTNRLATHLGDLTYHPQYGCDVYRLLGQGGTATANLFAAAQVAKAVRADARVARVVDAVAVLRGDGITATATAITVDGKRVPTGIPNGSAAAAAVPQ